MFSKDLQNIFKAFFKPTLVFVNEYYAPDRQHGGCISIFSVVLIARSVIISYYLKKNNLGVTLSRKNEHKKICKNLQKYAKNSKTAKLCKNQSNSTSLKIIA